MSSFTSVAHQVTDKPNWAAGLQVQGFQCALTSRVTDPCVPVGNSKLSGFGVGTPGIYKVVPTGLVVELVESTFGLTDSAKDKIVDKLIDRELEKALAEAFWYGVGATEMSAATSAAIRMVGATLPAMLKRFSQISVGVDPVVHLGLQSAVDYQLNEKGSLRAYPDLQVIVSDRYPLQGVALSGPVDYYRTDVEFLTGTQLSNNRFTQAADLLYAISVDPCSIVINDDVPAVTVGATGTAKQESVTVAGNTSATTINWGDGTSTTAVPINGGTFNHTYATAGPYTVTVGSFTRNIVVS